MARNRVRMIFNVVYGSAYIVAYLILLGLILITPTDAIERSIRNNQRYNVIILIAGYVVTVVTVIFAYAVRLYVNKTVLASIPKGWVPVDKGDVNKAVHEIIASGLDRSAAVAYEAKPRVQHNTDGVRTVRKLKLGPEEKEVELPPPQSPWGEIEHRGWASPNSSDLPNLQYSTVLSELPHLIEGRALTLAPPDPTSTTQPPTLDPEAIGLLQRAVHLSLRDYISHLAELGVISLDENATGFLQHYEQARFSNRPISMSQFRELMHLFAEVLRGMRPLDFDALDNDAVSIIPPSESDIDNNRPLTDPSTPQRTLSRASMSTNNSSVRRGGGGSSVMNPWYSAPNTPRRGGRELGANTTASLSRKSSSSNNSFAQTRHPYSLSSQPSISSMRSADSGGSVIRLATRDDDGMSPYVLNLDGLGR
ncbi:sucrase/ferredoxin domain-containing protein [Sarocladium implicatum]|nr:sucrase/ferredoxin domain-containing protein [Sarocladium implicatum]